MSQSAPPDGETRALLERAGQLAALEEAFASVERSGRGRVVIISGEAGVGKTALLQSFLGTGTAATNVLSTACDPLFTPSALGPLIFLAEQAGGVLEATVGKGATPHDVMLALVRALRSAPPTVLALEDLHWADEATLDVFTMLVRRVDTVPALVVGTYRDDELERAHPLRRVLGELRATARVRRIKLGPLSPAAVQQLAAPHGIDDRLLYERTAGNPFFVVEVIAGGSESIPATVREAVLARAAWLSPAGQQLLEAVAVVPQRVEPWLIRTLAGDAIAALDECVTKGMLIADEFGLSFRHELARLSVEESLGPSRRVALHASALAALVGRPEGPSQPARLVHHAEAAGDVDAVQRYALAAAERGTLLGAHREAATHYDRVLNSGAPLLPAERARLLELRSHECYLTDQNGEAIEALEQALACYRQLGDRIREGSVLRRLSEILWCPGRSEQSTRAARRAVEVLEPLPPGPELAAAYVRLAESIANVEGFEASRDLAERALLLAEELGETGTMLEARRLLACAKAGGGIAELGRLAEEAARDGAIKQAGETYVWAVASELSACRYGDADSHLARGLEYCNEHGLELFRLYLLAYRARLCLERGHWTEAASTADSVLRIPRTSVNPRITASVVLALVRARRGDPGHRALIEAAWAMAEPTGELDRLGAVAAARAEIAWLAGDAKGVAVATAWALPLAHRLRSPLAGELATWRRRAGLEPDESKIAEMSNGPYGPAVGVEAARLLWLRVGRPYEAALALADAGDPESLLEAWDELQRLEARRAAAIVARRLRGQGVKSLPRGPRPTTRRNEHGLTSRELEVLALLNEGLQNRQIAERLVVSVRTVDHHIEAILRKLGAKSRGEARAMATTSGAAEPSAEERTSRGRRATVARSPA